MGLGLKNRVIVHTRLVVWTLVLTFGLSWSQGFGDGPGMSTMEEGILKFGLYGRDSVIVGYNAKTADSGAVGGGRMRIDQSTVIRGDIYTFGDLYALSGKNYDSIKGTVTVMGNLSLGNRLIVTGSLYVQGNMNLGGHGSEPGIIHGETRVGGLMSIGNSNQFRGNTRVSRDSILTNSDFFTNSFGTPPVNLLGFTLRSTSHTAAQLFWNSTFSVPPSAAVVDYAVPYTNVVPAAGTCTVPMTVWWNSTHCAVTGPVGTAPNGSQILPPGKYGNLVLNHQSKIMFGEGIYEFESITMTGTEHDLRVYQPTGDRTQLLVNGKITLAYKSALAPYDTAGNKGGTILLYTNGTDSLVIGQENTIWASVIAPNTTIKLVYGTKLFGQALGKVVVAEQNFEGNDGRYIPFYPNKPKISLVFANGALINEGSGGGTQVFPITFAMDHENGLPVKLYFHTSYRLPAQPGRADASDINLITKDSVIFPIGATNVLYSGLLVNQDNNFEVDDWFDLVLDSVVNGQIDSIPANNVYGLGIRNDDAPPVMNFTNPALQTVVENVGTVQIPVSLSASSIVNSVANVTVSVATGTMAYSIPATITIPAGSTTANLVLTLTDDTRDEPNDTLRIKIRTQNAAVVTIGADSVKTIVVTDNDPPTALASGMQTVFTIPEPASAGTTLKIPVVLAQISGWNIPWSVLAVTGSGVTHAQLDQDYRLIKTNGTIPSGQLSDTIVVEILSDIWDEGDELFRLAFNSIGGSTNYLNYSGKDSIRVNIPNNDGPVLSDTTVTLAENPPPGARVSRLAGLLAASDTVMTYNWTMLTGGDAAYFGVANVTGQGWSIVVVDSTVLDFEDHPTPFVVRIQVCGSFHCDTSTVTIQLTDVMESPTILPPDTMSITENSLVGQLLDTVFVADGSGWGIVWRIDGGTGANNFKIDSLTGVITVKSGATLDYEATPIQSLRIIVKNESRNEDTVQVVVRLINVLEYSSVHIDVAQIPEGQRFLNPDTLWINADSLDLEWTYDQGDSAETIGFNQDGMVRLIRSYCDPTKDFCGSDTLVVRRNTQIPQIDWTPTTDQDSVPRYTVVMPKDSGDTRIYTNNPNSVYGGSITYIDSAGRLVTIPFTQPTILREGQDVLIIRTFTDPYGNTARDTIVVVLDTQAPNVRILTPAEGTKFWVYNIDVSWSVEGVLMDTLNRASLEKGENRIIRRYMDLAGNIGADTVWVTLDGKKNDIQISIVEPMVELKPEIIEQVRDLYPPRPDERFSLTGVNQQTLDEVELQWGTTGKVTQPGEDERRIYDGRVNPHLGPTLRIEARFQHVGGLNGEGMPRGGTMADLFERLREEGTDEEDALCGERMPVDPFTTPLWRNALKVEVEFFDNLGQFVDRFVIRQDSISAEFLNDGGVGVFYFTLEPDKEDMRLKTTTGRAIANGAYVVRGTIVATSTYLWCAGDYRKGDVKKSTETMLQLFGYRRGHE